MSSDFSRDPVKDSAPEHSGYDDSEHCGPESLHPTLTASAARDSAFVTHAVDGSRSFDLQRHQSVPYDGSSPRRSSAQDIFHLSPIHRGATTVEHEWCPLVDNPDPVHTQELAQRDPSLGHFTFVSSWNDGIYGPPAADSSLLNVGGFTPPINTEFPSWPQGVYTNDFPTLCPNPVSGETGFPQNNSGPLIQPPCPPYYAARLVSSVENTMSNQFQLSRSGSQGPSLIVDENYDSSTQHSTFGGGLHNSDSSFSPEMTMVPQRSYARMGGREKHRSIFFKVNGRSGIPARDAIGKIYVGLEGRDDQVFVDEAGVITLRLEWPGYLPWSRKIRLKDWRKTPRRIKLEKLATEVSKCLERFIREVDAGKYPDRECSDWRVGPEFIGIDRLVLVALDNVSRGSWQPRVGLLQT